MKWDRDPDPREDSDSSDSGTDRERHPEEDEERHWASFNYWHDRGALERGQVNIKDVIVIESSEGEHEVMLAVDPNPFLACLTSFPLNACAEVEQGGAGGQGEGQEEEKQEGGAHIPCCNVTFVISFCGG